MKRLFGTIAAGALLASAAVVLATPASATPTTTTTAPAGTRPFPFAQGYPFSKAIPAAAATLNSTKSAATGKAVPAVDNPALDRHVLSLGGKTTLTAGEFLTSAGSSFALFLDPTGPLQLFADYQEQPLWQINVAATNPVLTLQTDGNVVLRDGTGKPLWATNTRGANAAVAFGFLFDNGEVSAVTAAGTIPFSTKTAKVSRAEDIIAALLSKSMQYGLVMQQDGNLVLRHISAGSAKAIWTSNTHRTNKRGANGVFLTLQDDDNLVIRAGSTVLWSTATHSAHPGLPLLVLQDDGNLVLRSIDPVTHNVKVLWASGTAGKV